jgi:hypothetical protein
MSEQLHAPASCAATLPDIGTSGKRDSCSAGPPQVDEDDGQPPPSAGLPETIREVAVGVNYDVTRNVRIMSNVTTAVDDRPLTITSLTRLQLVF